MTTSTIASDLRMIDANILVYAFDEDSPFNRRCRALLESAQVGNVELCVAPQTLAEWYAVVTNPKRVSRPRTPAEATKVIDNVLSLPGLFVVPVPTDVVERWMQLLQERPVRGGKIFDLQLIATMQGNGLCKIYTFNVSDFEKVDGIEVLQP